MCFIVLILHYWENKGKKNKKHHTALLENRDKNDIKEEQVYHHVVKKKKDRIGQLYLQMAKCALNPTRQQNLKNLQEIKVLKKRTVIKQPGKCCGGCFLNIETTVVSSVMLAVMLLKQRRALLIINLRRGSCICGWTSSWYQQTPLDAKYITDTSASFKH